MAKQSIRSIRKGSVQWNEEDRLQMVSMLAKAGYAVQIVRKEVPGGEYRKSAQYEYVIEYGEKKETFACNSDIQKIVDYYSEKPSDFEGLCSELFESFFE